MKKEFIGFYNPTKQEIEDAWSKGIFAFDANTLLNLYRYSSLTRQDFLSAFKTLKKKLFLPHQAALEYHKNRLGVIDGLEFSYDNLYQIIEANCEKAKPEINQFKKHPSIIIDNVFKLYSDFLKKISSELEKRKKEHPDFKTKDEVLEQVTELFENAIGKEFSKDELVKIFDEGKVRYADNIPPGFADLENKRKKGERHVYGDLIIWHELINYSKKEKKPLIFVTDDRKHDWWTIENGKTIRPREELIKEFFDLTGIRILIYNADNFLHFAKERNLLPELKDKTIEEVKNVRISDESSYLRNIELPAFYRSTPFTTADILSRHSNSLRTPLTTTDILLGPQGLSNYQPYGTDLHSISENLLHTPFISLSDLLNSRDNQLSYPVSISDLLANRANTSSLPSASITRPNENNLKADEGKKEGE